VTIPLDAIDPEAGYRQWVEQYLWHVDQLPNVVQATGTVAMAPRRLRAAQLKERVSGGGYIDNMPVVDGPESRNATAVWNALRAYLTVAASRLGVEGPALPPNLPDDVELARQWAYAANEWLAGAVHSILDWPDLAALEGELFRLIRRARTRLDTGTVRRALPTLCTTCGERGVLVDWVNGPDGQPMLMKACKICGQAYTEGADQ
jgi:hypothetical protein